MQLMQTDTTLAPTVLVVDDDPGQVDLLRRFLTQQGIAALSAYNGQQRIEKVQTTNVDVIILDILMPRMNGLELCREFRNSPATRTIPIIILTATDDPEPRQEGCRMGVEEFLVKPISGKEWLVYIQTYLQAGNN